MEENATPLALASCSSLGDRVDVATPTLPYKQRNRHAVYDMRIGNVEHKERINNETAMRFVGCAPIFPPHFTRLRIENAVSM